MAGFRFFNDFWADYIGLLVLLLPDGYAMLMRPNIEPNRLKQLSLAATVQVILLCACVRYWLDRGLVFECHLLFSLFFLFFSTFGAPKGISGRLSDRFLISPKSPRRSRHSSIREGHEVPGGLTVLLLEEREGGRGKRIYLTVLFYIVAEHTSRHVSSVLLNP